MLRTMITASNTLNQLQSQIDTISNNISNSNTVGYKTKEARFSDGEGVMGKWTQVDYDAKMSGKNVFIEFNHGFTGQVRIQDGWWSRQDFAVLTGDGTTKTYKVYMDPGFIQVCYSQDWSMLGLGGIGDANLEPGNGQDLRIVKMYTLLEL